MDYEQEAKFNLSVIFVMLRMNKVFKKNRKLILKYVHEKIIKPW